MEKHCKDHGDFRDIVYGDAKLYLKMEEWTFGDNRGLENPIVTDATRCQGVRLEDGTAIVAGATVLATGGAAALWSRTTNPAGATNRPGTTSLNTASTAERPTVGLTIVDPAGA